MSTWIEALIDLHTSAHYGGCRLATPAGDYWHAVPHDFASRTLCGITLAGTSLSEGNMARAMCPACAEAHHDAQIERVQSRT